MRLPPRKSRLTVTLPILPHGMLAGSMSGLGACGAPGLWRRSLALVDGRQENFFFQAHGGADPGGPQERFVQETATIGLFGTAAASRCAISSRR